MRYDKSELNFKRDFTHSETDRIIKAVNRDRKAYHWKPIFPIIPEDKFHEGKISYYDLVMSLDSYGVSLISLDEALRNNGRDNGYKSKIERMFYPIPELLHAAKVLGLLMFTKDSGLEFRPEVAWDPRYRIRKPDGTRI